MRLSRNTIYLALSSFFADISTEMLFPILPIFLTQNLNATGSIVGLIDGMAKALQNIVQGLSGFLSDKLRKRKILALTGYFMAAISKPFIGMSTVWTEVLVARLIDRIGTGIRSAPRDALIASSVSASNRGKAFGLESLGDNLGAFLGPLLTAFLLVSFYIDIKLIFYLAIIPGIFAFLMIFLVTEKKGQIKSKEKIDFKLKRFPKAYWQYLLITAIFSLGNSGPSFLILKITDLGASLQWTLITYALFNLAAALISYPAGFFSDLWGRKTILLLSFAIFFIAYLALSLTTNITIVVLLFIFYGFFQGIFRSIGKAFAADFVPEHLHASGIAWYNTTVGLVSLLASIIGGLFWDYVSHSSLFFFGAGCAFIGILFLARSFYAN